MKGNSAKVKNACLSVVDDPSPNLSDISESDDLDSDNHKLDSGGNDGDSDDDDEDFDVEKMTNQETRKIFNDKVHFLHFMYVRADILPSRCPRMPQMQPRCSRTITTSKSQVPDPIAASETRARRPRDP